MGVRSGERALSARFLVSYRVCVSAGVLSLCSADSGLDLEGSVLPLWKRMRFRLTVWPSVWSCTGVLWTTRFCSGWLGVARKPRGEDWQGHLVAPENETQVCSGLVHTFWLRFTGFRDGAQVGHSS